MATSWCKVASNLDSHPKIIKAGRLGREVFLFALRLNAEPGNPVPGRLPKSAFEPWYIARQLQMPESEAVTGVTAAVTAGLLAEEGHSYLIVSWKDGWGKDNGTGAERTARWRENKKLEKCDSDGDTRDVTGDTRDGGDTDQKRREEKRKSPAQGDLALATILILKVIKNHPRSTIAKQSESKKTETLEKWADHIRKMREIDGHSEVEIKAVIDWCQSHSFWHRNIMSAETLREQWNKLIGQMGEKAPSSTSTGASKYEQPTLTFRIGDVEVER